METLITCQLLLVLSFMPLLSLAFYDLHHEMNKRELSHHFGVNSPDEVEPGSYDVVRISQKAHPSGILDIKMTAFGKEYAIRAKRNNKLLHPNATMVTVMEGGLEKRLSVMEDGEDWPAYDCHYLYSSDELNAGLSVCNDEEVNGFLNDDDQIMEIGPLNRNYNSFLNKSGDDQHHLVRKRTTNSLSRVGIDAIKLNRVYDLGLEKRSTKGADKRIEVGLFLGPEAYKIYSSYFDNQDKKIRELMLTYMNAIQALYHYPSLGVTVDFTIVHLELQRSWPFSNKGGEREQLLKSFCKYQGGLNPEDDTNPKHWDIGLFVSGMDFWANSGGSRSYVTMGLATVTGICTKRYGCVIGEMGVKSKEGQPYPSTGFTAVYVMAHEIGHNLGMSHDGSGNSCPKEGYIMSGSRGTRGETDWSVCSKNHMRTLNLPCLTDTPGTIESMNDHSRYGNRPGYSWSPDEQCQFLLQNQRARFDHSPSDMKDACTALKCKVPGKPGYWRAGPALDGTRCSITENKICIHGKCVVDDRDSPATKPEWSEWNNGPCRSGCISNSRGARKRERTCEIPHPTPIMSTCPGPSMDVALCDNYQKCKVTQTPDEWASDRCETFMKASYRLSKLIKPDGKQAKYNVKKPSQSCMVFCKIVRTNQYYSPRLELSNQNDLDVYFPDGTWCHNDGKSDYYCKNHQCLSTSRGARAEREPDVEVNQNAKPEDIESWDPELLKYFTIDENDNPLAYSLPHNQYDNQGEDEFVQDDALIPES